MIYFKNERIKQKETLDWKNIVHIGKRYEKKEIRKKKCENIYMRKKKKKKISLYTHKYT